MILNHARLPFRHFPADAPIVTHMPRTGDASDGAVDGGAELEQALGSAALPLTHCPGLRMSARLVPELGPPGAEIGGTRARAAP